MKARRFFTDEEHQFIADNVNTMTFKEIAEHLNRPVGSVNKYASRNGIKVEIHRMKKDSLKKRVTQSRHKHIDTMAERGVKYIRLKRGGFVEEHRHNWQQENGNIPAGHSLRPINGDWSNPNPQNWELFDMRTGNAVEMKCKSRATKSDGKYYNRSRKLTGASEMFDDNDFDNSENGWWMNEPKPNYNPYNTGRSSQLHTVRIPASRNFSPYKLQA